MTAWSVTRTVARPETWGLRGGGGGRALTPVVVGTEADRECGCLILVALDLSKPDLTSEFRFELAVAFQGCCPDHEPAAERARAAFAALPPSDRDLIPLLQELLDAEIG